MAGALRKVLHFLMLVSQLAMTSGDAMILAAGDQDCDATAGVCKGISRTSASKLEAPIQAIVHGNLSYFDSDFDRMVQLLSSDGFQEFAHSRDTFANHLQGTFAMLGAWGQPQEVRRLGLFHTAYSGDLFIFHYLCDFKDDERAQLRSVIGEEAENLVYLFGTTKRDAANDTAYSEGTLPSGDLNVKHRSGLSYDILRMPSRISAKIMLVSIADVFDQMLQVNAWRNVYQHDVPSSLYPGQVKPDIGMHWMSRVCAAISQHLDVVPPIFGHCTKELTYNDEVAARDEYWRVILHEHELNQQERETTLRAAIEHNPFIAEPHVVLSQVLFQTQRYDEAAQEASAALEIFYVWANCWDKRLPFRQWVSFTRIILLRSQRMAKGLSAWPYNEKQKSNVRAGMSAHGGGEKDLHLVSIRDMLSEM